MPDLCTDYVDSHVSGRLEDSGLTQSAIARELGMSRPALADRMRGRTAWKASELPRVAHLLGISPSDLLEGIE